jgi:hypothetical protein
MARLFARVVASSVGSSTGHNALLVVLNDGLRNLIFLSAVRALSFTLMPTFEE